MSLTSLDINKDIEQFPYLATQSSLLNNFLTWLPNPPFLWPLSDLLS